MSRLSDQLLAIYTAKIYPILAHNDPIYQQALTKAGMGWVAPDTIPPAHRRSFEQEMKLQSWLAAGKIEDAKSLEPNTIRAKVLNGPVTLYRVAQSGAATPPGIWWFTEKVAHRCRDEAGPDPQKRLDWLRSGLAVCYNWSRFDAIQRLQLHAGEEIPTVIGRGIPMPYYNVAPFIDRKTGQRVVNLPEDYWRKKGETLLGGELQIVLPWVPVHRIRTIPSL